MKEEEVDGEVVGVHAAAATAACISGARLEATGPGDAAAVGEAWVAGGICVPAFPLQRSFLLLNFVRF